MVLKAGKYASFKKSVLFLLYFSVWLKMILKTISAATVNQEYKQCA